MRRSAILVLVVMLLGSLGPPLSAAQEATPAAECPAMTAEDNKAVVTQFLEAVNAGDDAAAADLAAEGITHYAPAKGEREGDAEGFLRGQQASFPDATMTVDLLVAEGETVAAYVSWSGTLQGETAVISGQEVSIPEGQRDAEWVGAVFFQLECGKIAEVWPVIDRLGQLRDLGVITDEHLQSADPIATPAP
ncbi:MAG TPA: ester cyclase [Thermomicrobiales bacterium]|nr:ester cyclase [Thermomicrobiales bacterium]